MKMFHTSLLVIACFLCNMAFSQQITIDDNFTPQQLIESNFNNGCIEISNITSPVNGSIDGFSSYGIFQQASSNFPFADGIVLSTGNAVSGGNSLNPNVLNEGNNDWGSDTDLENALGITNTLNATSIEFDFVSISNLLQFNYLLASEEYFGDFPCDYSDGFAFLIKEAGTDNPYTNIALIPGTNIPVNTNTIHNEIVGFCPASNSEYFEGYNIGDTNYNGRTVVISASADIQPNITYHIKLIIADQTDKNYDSAVFIDGNSFSASVDLGEDTTTCANILTLNGDIGNPLASYSWYLNSQLIDGVTSPDLTITESGTYTVSVSIPIGISNCILEDTVVINLNAADPTNPITDYVECDDLSADGIATFDLSTKDDEVLAAISASNYNISYHYSISDAQNNLNAITGPIQNSTNPQTIFIRIENIENGCVAYSNFNLVVNSIPIISSPTLLLACDDINGQTEIDLTQKDDEITNGQTDLIVTYHLTQSNANAGINAIPQPFENTSLIDTVYVRVTNPLTGCFATTILSITIINSPIINTGEHYIDACDGDHDGFATFDLSSINNEVLGGLTGMNVSFYENYENALSGTNPIVNPNSYNNVVIEQQIIYIRVEDPVTGCSSVTPIELHTNLLLTGTLIMDFSNCDNGEDQSYDLAGMSVVIINELLDVTVTFYESLEDQANEVNALDPTIPYVPQSFPTTLYITINSLTCSEIAEIELTLNEVNNFPSIGIVDYCDDDQDGFTPIDLSLFISQVTDGDPNFTVSYFANEDDASTGNNPLPNPYTNTENPQTIFPRITSDTNGCATFNSFMINVLPSLATTQPTDILICGQDESATVDLTEKISELVSDTTDLIITFHNNLANAETGNNPFPNPSSFTTSTQLIYARAENANSGCYSIEAFTVFVNTIPIFGTINNYTICEEDSDNLGEFIFANKDEEILNGQIGKDVSYYTSQTDSDNRVNSIDKDSIYQNVSNPQTIYVRVENTTDIDCYATSSFLIEIGTTPQYNEPSDWFVCDDISNDSFEPFNLNIKIDEITQGMSDDLVISFYTSPEDAMNGTNPLPLQYTNAVNPQQIYVRIENGTICSGITDFLINVIQAPEAFPADPLEVCDTDYDGIATFDLTLSILDILDVRQDNISIGYYENMDDLETETNPITDPESYDNISNPQTVYVRITNGISNCFLGIALDLIVNLPPLINDINAISICDNPTDIYDLSQVNSLLIENSSSFDITYYATENNALQAVDTLSVNYNYQANDQIIYVRVENPVTNCFKTNEFQLIVYDIPIANIPENIEECDDDFDGLISYDLTQQNATILGNQNVNDFTITYHNSQEDADSGSNSLPTDYVLSNNEVIYVRLQRNNTDCYSTTLFSTIIHPRPLVDIPQQVICFDNGSITVSANTNNVGDTYLWSTNATTPEIEINQVGTYSVTVTTLFGCVSSSVFDVIESATAIIELTETIDFADPNNITVTISGIGNYLYVLDGGTPQESNVFTNVSIGYHLVTIIDLNGCSEITKEVLVIDIPKFMTPNGDGYFDTWHIVGVENLPGTVIHIYDRYGKLLAYLTSYSPGWNGIYNGHVMPATDYWFVADVKRDDIEFQVKGHFAIRR